MQRLGLRAVLEEPIEENPMVEAAVNALARLKMLVIFLTAIHYSGRNSP